MKRLIISLLNFFLLSWAVALADHVEPLLDGWVRHQQAPFNNYCPHYIDEKGNVSAERCIVGCVATALESIVSYHRQEIVLQDVLPAWSTKNFTTTDVPAGSTLDTRLILTNYGDGTAASVGMSEEDYAQAVDAVARLSLWCGMATQMNWGTGSSGADAANLVEPLQKVFGWKTAEYIDSYKYTPQQWREILKNELRNGRPVLYTAYTMNIDGHAFVVDGFDENDRFHINWGYGGSYDDQYHDITQLCAFANPEDINPIDVQQGFFCNQQALILSPDEIDKTLIADSLKRTGEEIVIEKISIDEAALTNKYTPVTITLHNTADIPLCSPFEIFTNAAGDKDLFKEGDYGALFGVNMEPDERKTMTIHCKFSKNGYRTLHVSPDDVLVMGDTRVNITKGSNDNLAFDPVTVEFRPSRNPASSDVDAVFTIPVTNKATERSGSLVTYGLMQGQEIKDGDWRHWDYYYLPANSNGTKSVTFRGLKPGDERLFIVRWPWPVRQQYLVSVPNVLVGSETIVLQPSADEDSYYDLSGRRTTHPGGGLLIHNGKKVLR